MRFMHLICKKNEIIAKIKMLLHMHKTKCKLSTAVCLLSLGCLGFDSIVKQAQQQKHGYDYRFFILNDPLT